MYDITPNVPLPTTKSSVSRFPFEKMGNGDSFEFPVSELRNVSNAASQYGKSNEKVFTVRNLKNGTGRVWRIK